MDYQIGSLADLITGSNTPNKRKVFEEDVSSQPEKRRLKKKRADNLISETHAESKSTSLQRKNHIDKPRTASPRKKVRNKEGDKAVKSDVNGEPPEKQQVGLYNDRTVFVGNVSIQTSKNGLKKLFEQFGKIEAIRFRCVSVADPRTPKKVAVIKKEFHPNRQTLHSYIRYASRDEAMKATTLNGYTYKDLHLRVNICDETEKPAALKAVFVGNIPFDAEEEDLWKLFEGCGSIESVRLVRDSRTSIGKGFGYVNFKSPDAVHLALEMEDVKLKNRTLRVSHCKAVSAKKKSEKRLQSKPSKKKRNRSFKIQSENASHKLEEGTIEESSRNSEFQGKTFVQKKKKKKFDKEAHRKKKVIEKIAPR